MKVVIIAGGQGTRIASVNSEIPKAMIPLDGRPVIERQVEMAARQGFREFIFLIGYLGEHIRAYFGDGQKWGVSIEYYHEQQPLGTAGALAEVADKLTDDFFVFYGDTVMDISMQRMVNFHKQNAAAATLYLHPNDHPYDSDIVVLDANHRVTAIANKPHSDDFVSHNIVNAALFIFSPTVLKQIVRGEKSHIEKNVLPACLQAGLPVFGYISTEYVKDMGTPERYQQVQTDWLSGRVHAMNLNQQQRAVFLDRDGVINLDTGQIYQPSQIQLVEGVAEALHYIHQQGFLAVCVTNQSVVARNLCTFTELDTINQQLETLLGKQNAYLDGMYICPHHPDSGYPEERKELKIKCNCRKPAPGLLIRAAREMNIDLSASYMIGDRETDIQAGHAAGVKQSVKIETNQPNSLLQVVKKLI